MFDAPDIDEAEKLALVKAEFVRLWARYPKRSPGEISKAAYKAAGFDPGFDFARWGAIWGDDLEVMEARDKILFDADPATAAVPSKDQLVMELLSIARDTAIDPKDRNAAYRNAMEALGHITKQVDKNVGRKVPTPPAIIFEAVNFDREPDALEEGAA